jgi:hypothetical protein
LRPAFVAENPEKAMAVFNIALRRAISVPKAKMDKMLAAEKTANADKPKRGPKPKRDDTSSAATTL